MENSALAYESFRVKWDKQASIRTKLRRMFSPDEEANTSFYPISRQPICEHKLVKAKGKEAIEYILVQSAYKFMHEIAVVEVDIVNNIATKIFNGQIDFGFSDAMRDDILAVIIDEAYHAFVANDFIQQVQFKTGIKPIKESRITQFENTIAEFKLKIPKDLHNALDVIAICIGESTLTKELFDMSKENNVHPLFRDIIMDHIADEGRHQILFREILKVFWQNLSQAQKDILGPQIADFLIGYLCPDMHIEFDKSVLKSLNFSESDINLIITDIYKARDKEALDNHLNPITKNIIKVMQYANIFEHEKTTDRFKALKFI